MGKELNNDFNSNDLTELKGSLWMAWQRFLCVNAFNRTTATKKMVCVYFPNRTSPAMSNGRCESEFLIDFANGNHIRRQFASPNTRRVRFEIFVYNMDGFAYLRQ